MAARGGQGLWVVMAVALVLAAGCGMKVVEGQDCSALTALQPCLVYLEDGGPDPSTASPQCCTSLNSLLASEPTCFCAALQSVAASLNVTRTQQFALACKTSIPASVLVCLTGVAPATAPTTTPTSAPTLAPPPSTAPLSSHTPSPAPKAPVSAPELAPTPHVAPNSSPTLAPTTSPTLAPTTSPKSPASSPKASKAPAPSPKSAGNESGDGAFSAPLNVVLTMVFTLMSIYYIS